MSDVCQASADDRQRFFELAGTRGLYEKRLVMVCDLDIEPFPFISQQLTNSCTPDRMRVPLT